MAISVLTMSLICNAAISLSFSELIRRCLVFLKTSFAVKQKAR